MLKRGVVVVGALLAIFGSVVGAGLLAPLPGVRAAPLPFFVNIAANDGLAAYFKFDENGGLLTRGFPNTGLTGTLSMGASFTGTHPAAITRFDPEALSLNSGFVAINANATLNALTQTFTLAAWVRRTATGAYHAIYDSGTQTNHWWVFINDKNHFGFGVRNVAEYSTTAVITDTAWHHVAVVSTGAPSNNLRLYLDGGLDSIATLAPVAAPSGPKSIGRLSGPTAAFFAGQIDELRVYTRALSTVEVHQLGIGKGCPTAGTSWATAFSDLQCGLDAAPGGQEIWVAVSPRPSAYYLPGTSPTATFVLKNGVSLHGGFAGNETTLAQRPFVNFNTFDVFQLAQTPASWMRGDVLGDDGDNYANFGDNLHSVVTITGTGVTMDGFSIQGGNAAGLGGGAVFQPSGSATISMTGFFGNRSAGDGGGIAVCCGAQITLQNVLLFGNAAGRDGGGAALSGGATVTISEAAIWLNSAAARGGGIASGGTQRELLRHSTLRDNSAANGGGHSVVGTSNMQADGVALQHNTAITGGGGLLIQSASGVTLTNLELVANQAGADNGGGIQVQAATIKVINSTFVSNSAGFIGAAIGFHNGVSLTTANSIFWLDAPEEIAGDGSSIAIENDHNLEFVDPQFVRAPNPGDGSWATTGDNDYGDLRLRLSSPAIDAGSNGRVPVGISRDFDGGPRFADVRSRADTGAGTPPIVDIGAHEDANGIFLPLILR